jgi:hypothetical protein
MSKLPTLLLVAVLFAFSGAAAVGAPTGAPKRAPAGGNKGNDGGSQRDPTAGFHKVWEARLPITGREVASPKLDWADADTYRLEITGVLDTGKLGARYDARLRSISAKEFRKRHDHLRFGSQAWLLLYGNHHEHRYVYRLDPSAGERPGRARLSLEGIPYRYRISPARLRRESTSTLRVSLWKKGPAPARMQAWLWGVVGLAVCVALGGAIWVVRARRKRARRAD